MNPIKKVLVFGGTHGNEWTGIYAIKKYAHALKQEFPDLDIHFIHANPEAFLLNRRFKDEDLNRAFQFLHEERPASYEHRRAKEMKALIDAEPCYVVDLHTTTSNMGHTVIITHDQPLNFFIAKKLTESLKDCRAILSPDPNKKYLASQSLLSLMIEVGPVPNALLRGDLLEGTLNLLKEIFRALSTPTVFTGSSGKIELYEEIEDVSYPKTESGEINGYIHPELQDQDFKAVEGTYKAFKTFDGHDIVLEAKERLYPIFINEAAYYPGQLAFTLCRKKTVTF